ncbi:MULTISPECIES: hypothetical protein [Legionella]|uniref:Uncharacterized protein n=1 Tax=Legionella drozanskii LLAP-1 TaxID=1212489 RepID=A0A0W0SXP6_9GAMM|nr:MULTISPECIES: hypothetical protein [Legionella]KTC88068.1 hypothetical protein Ldro_1687 [Legionella drozanskii LLAP-1]PJE09327.1 MAG: hypothetical protein CK430_11330 [Legionella sp.]
MLLTATEFTDLYQKDPQIALKWLEETEMDLGLLMSSRADFEQLIQVYEEKLKRFYKKIRRLNTPEHEEVIAPITELIGRTGQQLVGLYSSFSEFMSLANLSPFAASQLLKQAPDKVVSFFTNYDQFKALQQVNYLLANDLFNAADSSAFFPKERQTASNYSANLHLFQIKKSISCAAEKPKEASDYNSLFTPGNTALHDLMESVCSDTVLEAFIDQVGRAKAAVMAKTLNDEKELPIDLVGKDLSFEEQDKVNALLLPLTLPSGFKPLSEKLYFEDILAVYQVPEQSPLAVNLYLGVEAVNYVRDHVKKSSSHPDSNSLSIDTESGIEEEITALRKESTKTIFSPANRNQLFKSKTKHPAPGFRKQKLTKEGYDLITYLDAEISIETEVGNCYEMSAVAKYFFYKVYQEKAQLVKLVNFSGHVFVVIGCTSESSCYKDWPEDTVICDPWSGEVFPAAMIPEKLKGFQTRVVCFFNSQFETRDYNLVVEPNFSLYPFEFDKIFKDLGVKHVVGEPMQEATGEKEPVVKML